MGFAFETQVGVHAFASDRRVPFRASSNGLAYVPIDCDVYSQSDLGGEYLKISFAPALGEPWPARRFSDVIDAAAIDSAYRLRQKLLAKDGIDEFECEPFVLTLKERAFGVVKEGAMRPHAASSMTPRRLRLVQELIEARLETRLTVQELAETLGLSAGFFCRAFKSAVGKAPHDYIIDRRISRARALLRNATLDLSATAHASGFSSHAHMTATFRRRLGISPSELRSGFG